MGRRAVAFTEDSVSRAIKAVKKAGVEIKTISIDTNTGRVVINGDGELSEKDVAESIGGYL